MVEGLDSEVEENPTIIPELAIQVETASVGENRAQNTTPKSPAPTSLLSLPPNAGRENSPPPQDDGSLNFFLEYGYGIADPGRPRTLTIEEIEAQLSDGENEIFNEEVRRANAGEESLFNEKFCNGKFGFLGAAHTARMTAGLKPHPRPNTDACPPNRRSMR